MPTELPPQYDPQATEPAIYQKWLAARVFHAAPDDRPAERRFSMVIPPPNVTGALHLGHAINGTIQDILARYHRMRGDNTLWMPGIDHAGIATQAVVERTIFEQEKKSRHDLGRDELVRRIWEWKEQFGTRILEQQARLGASCDWDRTRFTLDEVCAKAVREAFFRMFKDGLIFRGKRLVNWDTHLQTAVADDEIYYEPMKGQMTSIKYPLADDALDPDTQHSAPSTQHFLIVATTRPETMLGDTAVAVHPDDQRYKHLIGKHVIVPLVGRTIPIIADGLLVDPAFGTGVVKVTPAHDPNDYATGVRHNLEQINLLTPDGKVNENGAGAFRGTKYSYTGLTFASAARKAVLKDLEALNLVADKKPHDHEVGHSDRSKTPIEPYLSDQWFVRMGDIVDEPAGELIPTGARREGIKLADGTRKSGLAQAAMDAVHDGRVKITPERYAKGYLDWLGQKRDWCISRQLWWGHRIPVWTLRDVSRPGTHGNPDLSSKLVSWRREGRIEEIWHTMDDGGMKPLHICVRDMNEQEIISAIEAAEYVSDPDVLDTWFSSALWPISTMGWPAAGVTEKPADQLLPYFYPTSVLSTARDILTLWVARMVMFGLYCHGEVPFKDVYIHAVIQDGEGRTMSKSKGNGVDPVDIIHSHGADALRFTLAQMATETQDIRMPVVKDPTTGRNTSPKFDIGRNFANKIWNASRYILMNIGEGAGVGRPGAEAARPQNLEDRWILSRLHATIRTAEEAIVGFHFADYATALYSFFWTDLCDWYLEISKARIKAGDAAVRAILLHCMQTALKLLHPMMPFITEELWSKLPTEGSGVGGQGSEALLESAAWPAYDAAQRDAAAEAQIAIIQSITSAIREIQNRYPAAKGKAVTLKPRDAATQQTIEQSRLIIEPLAGITLAENSPAAAKPADAATAVLPEAEIYIAGVIDKAAETAKLTKRQAELTRFIAGNQAKLANDSFTSKAPEKVVKGLRDQLAQQEAELASIQENLAALTR